MSPSRARDRGTGKDLSRSGKHPWQIGTEFRHVWRQAERELRTTADQLDTHLPIDWQS